MPTLFADLLQLELRRTQPAELAPLHGAAAGWFAGGVVHDLADQGAGLAPVVIVATQRVGGTDHVDVLDHEPERFL